MKAIPYVCPECRDTENYYGLLVFPVPDGIEWTPIPTCPNHKNADTGEDKVVELVPVA